MFGYVTIDKPELKVKEFYRYKSYYCGLCRTLKEEYGFRGRMTLSYDMAFLVLFLTSLYETPTKELQSHCPLHPVKKIPMLQNEISEYGAKMNILLVYFKCEDDWKDDKSLKGIAGMHLFRKKAKELCKEYKRQAQVIQKQLKVLAVYEENRKKLLIWQPELLESLWQSFLYIKRICGSRSCEILDFILENSFILWMPMMI